VRGTTEQLIALGLYDRIVEVQDELICDIVTDILVIDLSTSLDYPEQNDEITCNVWKDELEAELCVL